MRRTLIAIGAFAAIIGIIVLLGSREERSGREEQAMLERMKKESEAQEIQVKSLQIEEARKAALAEAASLQEGLTSSRAILKTNYGDMEVAFFTDGDWNATNFFAHLAETGFYQNLRFMVMRQIMIVSGDPKGDGSGQGGLVIRHEKVKRKPRAGTVALLPVMRTGLIGSQLAIFLEASPPEREDVTYIGQVVSGLEVAFEIEDTTPIQIGEREHQHEDEPEHHEIEPRNKVRPLLLDVVIKKDPSETFGEPETSPLP